MSGATGDRYLIGEACCDVFRVSCWTKSGGCEGRKLASEYLGMTAALIAAQRWLACGPDARVKIKRVVK